MNGMKPAPSKQADIPELQIDRIRKSYGNVCALDEVSFEVGKGEFFALLGPNGAGKTTLFQLLTGLFVADSGSIRISGLDIGSDTIRALARIGVVFQTPTLDLDLTVRTNLEFHGRLHGMGRARIKRRIDDELNRLGLTDSADQVCRNLSGGNRRKVELARSLLHEPRILLMDEATVGLDPASRQALVAYVRELTRKRNISVLWTTHLVDEVQDADQILILHKGKVRQQGTAEELVTNSGTRTLTDAFLSITGAANG
jgi:ABC-2 type transport system ATP-binding protein